MFLARYATSKLGFLALLKIRYSCRLEQSTIQNREKGRKSKRKPKDCLLAKWKMLLSICICSIELFLPQTQENHKDKSAGSHLSVCSFVSSQSFNNVLLLLASNCGEAGEGRKFLVSPVPDSSCRAGHLPGMKLLSKETLLFSGTAIFKAI